MFKETAVVLGVVAILSSMLLPLPPQILDFLLVGNLVLALILLGSALYISEPVKLSSLPTILLLATLYRLALNISTTRLILSRGNAGEVVQAFGTVVTSGNLVVGIVIFLVITLIQFIVIAKGAERVAEVSARFTLDAMPGKQMSIDADVRAGLINFETARQKRDELQVESRFYGALDGAMKFIKGDAIAGIVITGINIIGGLLIGIAINGMEIPVALGRYTTLTIGDGLLSQIPALLNSLAAGMIVTRVVSEKNSSLANDMLTQLWQLKKVRIMVACSALVLGLVGQMPQLPFLLVSFVLFLSCLGKKDSKATVKNSRAQIKFQPKIPAPLEIKAHQNIYKTLGMPFADAIETLRQDIYEKHGLIIAVPEMSLGNDQNVIEVSVRGVPATKITIEEGKSAEEIIAQIVDTLNNIITNRLEEFLDDIMTRRLVDFFDERAPELVSSVIPTIITITQLTALLRDLITEGVPIKNFDIILQAVAEYGPNASHHNELLAKVRSSLKRVISNSLVDENGILKGYTLAPALDLGFARLDAEDSLIDVNTVENIARQLIELGEDAILITSSTSRKIVSDLLKARGVRNKIIAYDEISTDVQFQDLGVISVRESDEVDNERARA